MEKKDAKVEVQSNKEEKDSIFKYLGPFAVVIIFVFGIIAAVADGEDDGNSSSEEVTDGLPDSVSFTQEMIVTSTPLASAAGQQILEMGGTAADAFVAAQVVLSLVEPQSCGIGGGMFLVYYDAETGETTTIDAREKAPAASTEDRFGELSFIEAWQSGLSVGVPGVLKAMEYMQDRWGVLNWTSGELFDYAIDLARNGYSFTGRSSDQIASLLSSNAGCDEENRVFLRDVNAFEMYVSFEEDEEGNIINCSAKPEGAFMQNEEYALTLEALRDGGSDAFYFGQIAEDIAAAVQNDPRISGDMTVDDLANYNIVEREPVCFDYRGYEVCGMGPPSSGALAVGQILGILENFEPNTEGNDDFPYPLNIDDIHNYNEAMRLAFADRGMYVGDSDFVDVPIAGMLDKDYLSERSELITDVDMGVADAGVPPGAEELSFTQTNKAKNSGTAHVSIVDRYGNALSVTTTIESSFGNGVMVDGFMLNNELTDFNFDPTGSDGNPAANRVQANKRPRSSMSPSIVFEEVDGEKVVKYVTGSPGGSRIIGYTCQSIVSMIDYELDPQEAVNVPHYMNRNSATGSSMEPTIEGVTLDYNVTLMEELLNAKGHNLVVTGMTSGLSIIEIVQEADGSTTLIGGADQRRDGTVAGSDL
eukprot:augustus_masked-scaffold_13-processed-gene-11.78-mRNA-1 protein AED:0.43 eAED:0.43 QI:0/-1/0/1/-1/1/1/0/645